MGPEEVVAHQELAGKAGRDGEEDHPLDDGVRLQQVEQQVPILADLDPPRKSLRPPGVSSAGSAAGEGEVLVVG